MSPDERQTLLVFALSLGFIAIRVVVLRVAGLA
jgi:hypothetical protein